MAPTDDASSPAPTGVDPRENSIRPARRFRRMTARAVTSAAAAAGLARRATPAPAVQSARAMPAHVRERFIQVRQHYYFPDGTRAFTDRGHRLTTPSENTEVIASLVAIAKAREWKEITVRGTERFRKAAWLAARLAGLEVRGYRPSEVELAVLVRRLGREKAVVPDRPPDTKATGSKRVPDDPAPSRSDLAGLLSGRLIEHGRATYRHEPRSPMSYFVTLETARGKRTFWGVDLERALKESLTRPAIGDEVGLRTIRQETVKVKTPERDADGKLLRERELDTHRNRWIVEKRDFFESRAQAARTVLDASVDPRHAVRTHPELVGTYLQLRAAELAAKQFQHPDDRERFVGMVRSVLADGVARGEPLPPVRLRERPAERPPQHPAKAREPERAPARA